MENWQKNALKKIRDLIEESSLDQKEFAKKAKVSETHLSAVLNGSRPLTRQYVAQIADYVKKPTEWFWGSAWPSLDEAAILLERFAKASEIRQAVLLYLATMDDQYRILAADCEQHAERQAIAEALTRFAAVLDSAHKERPK